MVVNMEHTTISQLLDESIYHIASTVNNLNDFLDVGTNFIYPENEQRLCQEYLLAHPLTYHDKNDLLILLNQLSELNNIISNVLRFDSWMHQYGNTLLPIAFDQITVAQEEPQTVPDVPTLD